MVKSRSTRSYRALVNHLASQHGRKRLRNPVCGVLPIVPTRRRRDIDNVLASLKSALDGLTDNGWWEDDSELHSLTVRASVYAKNWTRDPIIIVADEAANEDVMLRRLEGFAGAVRMGPDEAWDELVRGG